MEKLESTAIEPLGNLGPGSIPKLLEVLRDVQLQYLAEQGTPAEAISYGTKKTKSSKTNKKRVVSVNNIKQKMKNTKDRTYQQWYQEIQLLTSPGILNPLFRSLWYVVLGVFNIIHMKFLLYVRQQARF